MGSSAITQLSYDNIFQIKIGGIKKNTVSYITMNNDIGVGYWNSGKPSSVTNPPRPFTLWRCHFFLNCLFIDDLEENIKMKGVPGLPLAITGVRCLAFADDVVLLTSKAFVMEGYLNKFGRYEKEIS